MYTFIIIDDEYLIRQGTLKKLSSMADTINCIGEAENGKEGISLIEQLHPDIVILDMQMPVMGGTELLPYLAEHFPDIPLVVISGYRDFDYIKHAMNAQAIDYVLKPFNKDAIIKAMEGAIARLESKSDVENQILSSEEQKEAAYYDHDIQYLTNLILGYHTESSTISSEKLSYINHTHNMFLVTMYYQNHNSENNLQNFLDENGFGDLALYLTSKDHPQLGFLILFIPEYPAKEPVQMIRQIVDACTIWLDSQGSPACAGISNEHDDLTTLHHAYKECSSALNTRVITGKNARYQFYQSEVMQHYVDWKKQDEFLFRIEAGMEEDVRNLCKELCDLYLSIPDFTLGDIKYHCYQLSGLCRNLMSYYFNQDLQSDSNSMENVITSIFSLEELFQYYQNFFLNICHMLKNRSVYAGNDMIEKLKVYVERNYQKDLNLEYISSLFYMNRSYLSHLFKQRTGDKFVDYVNQIRIEKAKELLLKSDRKMYQIARNCGYDNVKYFFRVFKKYTGITPVQFQIERGITSV